MSKILIVDDDIETIKLLEAIVQMDGHETSSIQESKNAIQAVESFMPDLVLLDIMMPEISGLDILRQMRRDPALANIPVIVVTAKSMPSDIKNGMEAGASTYLTKPVGYLELKEAVERTLANKPAA